MATISWTASSGNWTNAADWSTGTVPTSSDSVSITRFGGYTVSVTTNVAAQYLTINPSADKADVLRETAGFMDVFELDMDGGNVYLGVQNYIHLLELNGGTVTLGNVLAAGAYTNLDGGTLLFNASGSAETTITYFGSSTLAVAHGATVALELETFDSPTGTLTIGTSTDDGTVVIASADQHHAAANVTLAYGTLVDHGDFFMSGSLTAAANTTIDLQGRNLTFSSLNGAGNIVDSQSPAILTIQGGSYSGTISGPIEISATNNIRLSGVVDVTGGTVIAPAAFIDGYVGTFDLPNDLGISGGGSFYSNGILAKTGGTGVSTIAATVSSSGTIVANHGTLAINNLASYSTIHGRQTALGSTGLSVSAAVTRDLGDAGRADILFRNGAGVTYLYEMNDATVTNGATLSTQVGTNWQIKGIGDFDGNGSADLLWVYNNAANASDPLNGISYITLQNGPATTNGNVVQQLASVWQVAGVGDFDGDGLSDVLYRNTSTGQTYLDFMNGASVQSNSGFTSAQISDPHWQIAGVGDFDEDGKADILWRYDNSSNAADPLNGVVYEWMMNGATVVSQGLVSSQPGSDKWQVAGTGDFDGDGHTDILFRYENSANAADSLNGFTYIDFMNGTSVTSGAPTQWQIDISWSIASIGDFNGDAKSDILFQRVSDSETYIWDMNGAATTAGNFTTMQSGPGWTVQNGVLDG